ncbi:MAG TPA: hypothetical protein VHS96_14095, partial [Bacteroidia bacterium]|nr:hypothetical protein [Bacteroidia bacterium]
MKKIYPFLFCLLSTMACLIATSCGGGNPKDPDAKTDSPGSPEMTVINADTPLFAVVVNRDIRMKHYFPFMDSVVLAYDSLVGYALTEHLLVRSNPWIIDTLQSYDYDLRMPKGQMVKDQKEEIMLRKGDTLWVPNDRAAERLLQKFQHTVVDVNVPEFKLRILEGDTV